MWPEYPQNRVLNRHIVAQPAKKIAELAGLNMPEDRKFIAVEETGIGPDHPFSGEKLSIVTTFINIILSTKLLTKYAKSLNLKEEDTPAVSIQH